MRLDLHAGIEQVLRYRVPLHRTVPALLPEATEFAAMPAVLATGFLVGLLEWTCMRAVAPFLDVPRELTLGTHIDVSHCAPTPPGATLTLQARLTHVHGRRLCFEVQAHDGVEVISRGIHERFVVERDAFLDKVDRKTAHAPPG
jgi:fluoroacetyl-CoA thioesterase